MTSLSASGVSQWTEYWEWNDPRSTCPSQPMSRATFSLRANGGALAPVSTNTNTNGKCPGYTSVTVANGRATQTNGIGSSVRGTITVLDGLCLNAEGGVREDANAILYACPGRPTDNEAWVVAADGSIRLVGDMCLTAKGTRAGAPVAMTSCLPGSSLQRWSAKRGDLVSAASGLCIVRGGITPWGNTQLVLGDCVGVGWRTPAR